MKNFITAALLCMVTMGAPAQEPLIKWDETRQLSWEDFGGKVNDTSTYDAECFAEIRYNYKFYSPQDYEFEVYANFDKNVSWSRKEKQSESLLRHEQMHFNIAQLFARKLQDDFENFDYTANFAGQILQLFNRAKADYQAMQRQYDEETNHSLNRDKQQEWEGFITTELRKTKLNLQLADNIKKTPLNKESEIYSDDVSSNVKSK